MVILTRRTLLKNSVALCLTTALPVSGASTQTSISTLSPDTLTPVTFKLRGTGLTLRFHRANNQALPGVEIFNASGETVSLKSISPSIATVDDRQYDLNEMIGEKGLSIPGETTIHLQDSVVSHSVMSDSSVSHRRLS